jgi:hypothetical protein
MRRWRKRGGRLPGLMRLWRPDGNPLRRTADRVEAAIMAGLIAAFLCGAPVAGLAAGQAAAAGGLRAEQAQAAWHRVTAVLLQKAPASAHPMFQVSLEPLVAARWKAPDGTPRTGEVYAPAGAAAGSTVTVWINGSGRPTASPLQRGDVIEATALAASLAAVAVAAVLALLGLLARWVLDRRRLAAWETRWAVTGPQWTRRR